MNTFVNQYETPRMKTIFLLYFFVSVLSIWNHKQPYEGFQYKFLSVIIHLEQIFYAETRVLPKNTETLLASFSTNKCLQEFWYQRC